MCGILASLNNGERDYDSDLEKINKRGPDMKQSIYLSDSDIYLGFTRLSINDVSINGMQPMSSNDKKVHLICNGEIYNFKELIKEYDLTLQSQSDCEAILRLYCKLNPDDFGLFIDRLDGEFAFVLVDQRKHLVYACRDIHGVRPLFIGKNEKDGVAFASEMKALTSFCNHIEQVVPGTYVTVDNESNITHTKHYDIFQSNFNNDSIDTIYKTINTKLRNAVAKRLMSDRPICCLLSGGLDSSLIAALVASHFPPYSIHTFSIGFEGSPDIEYAKLVANHIKSIHHVLQVSEQDFLNEIENTIHMIESYDTTTVRASIGNYLISEHISENTEFKVVFNGDYSDEVCGGYKYFKNAPSSAEFDIECRRLVHDICYFDSLRSDRTISSQGLEARVPFSDKDLVSYYFSIHPDIRNIPDKYLLRKSFEHDNLIPSSVLWRPKEAFSDGVSKSDKSWHHTIHEYVNGIISDDLFENEKNQFKYNTPELKESYYYRMIFEQYYKSYDNVIPYFWLPKWCKGNIKDPSAREIS